MDDMHPLIRHGYLLLAAVAGAITALSFRQWKAMTAVEVSLTLFVGASFAVFVTPLIADWMFGPTASNKVVAAVTYLTASGSNVLIPLAITWLKGFFAGFRAAFGGETKGEQP